MIIGIIIKVGFPKPFTPIDNDLLDTVLCYLITKDVLKLYDDLDVMCGFFQVSGAQLTLYDIYGEPDDIVNSMQDLIHEYVSLDFFDKLPNAYAAAVVKLSDGRRLIKLAIGEEYGEASAEYSSVLPDPAELPF